MSLRGRWRSGLLKVPPFTFEVLPVIDHDAPGDEDVIVGYRADVRYGTTWMALSPPRGRWWESELAAGVACERFLRGVGREIVKAVGP